MVLDYHFKGYKGKGIELRERRTWPGYPAPTREALVEQGIDPPKWFPNTLEEWQTGSWAGKEDCPIEEGMFLIGNHADEMTVGGSLRVVVWKRSAHIKHSHLDVFSPGYLSCP